MRLCILTHTLNPKTGAGVLAKGIIDGVQRNLKGVDISVMTSDDYIKPSLSHVLKNWPYIRRKVRSADIIHAIDGYPYGVVAYFASLGMSKPLIITTVGSGSTRRLGSLRLRAIILRWIYRRASVVVAISNYIASEIKKVLPQLRVEVIGPDVDYNFYNQTAPDKDAAGDKYKYIISQGELKRRKGYSEILPVIKKVTSLRPGIRYVIVADTGRNELYQNELYRLMDRLGIRNKIIIRGGLSREELREAYRNALLYLAMPKNNDGDIEGFGMSIMEAASTGTPAVVGRGSGADDAVSNGKSGFLVDGRNEKEVVEKILSIIDNETLRKSLSEGALSWAKTYNMNDKAKKYIALYEKV